VEQTNKFEKVIVYDVKVMTCETCVNAVEKAVLKVPGVKEAKANLPSQQLRIVVDEMFDEKVMVKNVKLVGYTILKQTKKQSLKETQLTILKNLKYKLIISIIVLVPLLYISMGHMIDMPIPDIINPNNNALNFVLAQLILTIPIIVLSYKVYVEGFKVFFRGKPSVDTLVSAGVLVAFLYGIFGLVMIGDNDLSYVDKLYFIIAGVTLVLYQVSKYLEQKTNVKKADELERLMKLRPEAGILYKDGKYIETPIDELKEKNQLLIWPGEVIITDGIIVKGETSVDESMLTGEVSPIHKKVSDKVIGGTVNLSETIIIKVTSTGEDTILADVIKRKREEFIKRAPIRKLADKFSGVFFYVALVLALLSFAYWLVCESDLKIAIDVFAYVLIVSCPCALSLVMPVVNIVSSSIANKNKLLIFSDGVLEASSKVTLVAFDKTEILTVGNPVVVDVIPVSVVSTYLIIQIAASLEQKSSHSIAHSLLKEAKENKLKLLELHSYNNYAGYGIEGILEGRKYYFGNKKLMKENNINIGQTSMITNEYGDEGKTPLYLATEKEIIGIISVKDKIKEEARIVVNRLHEKGIKTVILSGDDERTVNYIKEKTGINKAYGALLPEDKQKLIKNFKENDVVLMAGDGIKDANALKEADVGVGFSKGTNNLMSASDVTIMNDDLFGVLKLIAISRKTVLNVKQNILLSFLYNVIGIPFAVGIIYLFGGPLLTPLIAVIIMVLSIISILINVLRLKFYTSDK
jgi:Cu+-exporting ATPase